MISRIAMPVYWTNTYLSERMILFAVHVEMTNHKQINMYFYPFLIVLKLPPFPLFDSSFKSEQKSRSCDDAHHQARTKPECDVLWITHRLRHKQKLAMMLSSVSLTREIKGDGRRVSDSCLRTPHPPRPSRGRGPEPGQLPLPVPLPPALQPGQPEPQLLQSGAGEAA